MNNMKLVLTPPPIYHGSSTCKTLLEEKFAPVNKKKCGCQNVRKCGDIKDGEKYTT